jgi:dihydrofolate synthase / folylpolyglutamate synthase
LEQRLFNNFINDFFKMSHKELLERLYSLNAGRGMKLGLEQMRQLCASMGSPESKFQSVHIAGTNGKGSVAIKMAKGLESLYPRVGLFTSPHIASFRERIRINGEMISIKDTDRLLKRVIELPGTFFELTTLLAFLYFAEQKVDIAVIETGLGGRLDATNVITPRLSIITSISLEHTEILGDTVEKIAGEKAGIIKPGVPVILGPHASMISSPQAIYILESFPTVEMENRAIAQKGLELFHIPSESLRKALTARLPCRMERIGDVIFDVAHNPDAIDRFFDEEKQRPLQVVCGLSATKDLHNCLQTIRSQADHIHLTEAPNGRGAKMEHLYNILLEQGASPDKITQHPSITQAMSAATSKGLTAVLGTFFIMAEARRFLNLDDIADPFDLNEK